MVTQQKMLVAVSGPSLVVDEKSKPFPLLSCHPSCSSSDFGLSVVFYTCPDEAVHYGLLLHVGRSSTDSILLRYRT